MICPFREPRSISAIKSLQDWQQPTVQPTAYKLSNGLEIFSHIYQNVAVWPCQLFKCGQCRDKVGPAARSVLGLEILVTWQTVIGHL